MEKEYKGTEARYINPLTDYGFKKIFGDEEIMRAFLSLRLKQSISLIRN